MPEEKRFDPRFNPAFQRGFDASAERARRANVTPSLTPEDVVYGRSANPNLTPPPPRDEEADERTVAALEVPSPASPNDYRNPFVLALWLFSIAMVGGGIAILLGPIRLVYSNGGASNEDAYALFQMLFVVSLAVLTVGLGTVSGLLFWHAAAWRRAHR
jgi:hypothetical protein